MSIFDVIGPVMIGPSSSHTAGAAKIGLLAKNSYPFAFDHVTLTLYNSFAETGPGHGTLQALTGGLLGFSMDDERIPQSLEIAEKKGIKMEFRLVIDPEKHPNFVSIAFHREALSPFIISGISIGGGHAKIVDINHNKVEYSGRHDLLIMEYQDICGMVAFVGDLLANHKINIAYMQISRDANEEKALAILKLDAPVPADLVRLLQKKDGVYSVVAIPRWKEEGVLDAS